jgi:hypothetical protein
VKVRAGAAEETKDMQESICQTLTVILPQAAGSLLHCPSFLRHITVLLHGEPGARKSFSLFWALSNTGAAMSSFAPHAGSSADLVSTSTRVTGDNRDQKMQPSTSTNQPEPTSDYSAENSFEGISIDTDIDQDVGRTFILNESSLSNVFQQYGGADVDCDSAFGDA